ncbi:stage III sporulation protein AA [Clostridium estertheticum]|uniref:stage III sporulation protein AA n=1 Tax=Clostridium estertheticum TaxID=238834 RepID=UPI001C6E9ABF|nr:stage III sporulation protein AA [Clostridium estertheticum]MBW9151874.1 stage III sporulation protein AA [Clostridium estertheticum]MBX4265253.1 stage III sporulation protein AA [Clostridium estertheticum]MBX4269290.1 stage III sporulation protein AA [Clostridium estertheticum]WLC79362.1 stage III sporulation protein AA [Clostridium estertheticum]WLC85381.1 stage III sporulation protein AA [Clostridium estertheticum]
MLVTKDLFEILPKTIRNILEKVDNLQQLEEIRVKVNKPLFIHIGSKEKVWEYIATPEDLKYIMQRISNYSIYAFEDEIRQGYITIKGGHRVGLCGICVIENNSIKTIKDISSINIRACKEIIGCADKVMPYIINNNSVYNTIIISPPKCGKTTLIRDISRQISKGYKDMSFRGKNVSIIDERSEIAGSFKGIPQMDVGVRTDVLDNCPKSQGIMMAIRSMSPDVIVCDEIGTKNDMESILMALNSGISLITTIHGFGIEDLYKRLVFKDIVDNYVFTRGIVLSNKKGIGTIERIYDFTKGVDVWRS